MSEKQTQSGDLDPVVQDVLHALTVELEERKEMSGLRVIGSPDTIGLPVSLKRMLQLLQDAVKKHYAEWIQMDAMLGDAYQDPRFLRIVGDLAQVIEEQFRDLLENEKKLQKIRDVVSAYLGSLILVNDKVYSNVDAPIEVAFLLKKSLKYKLLMLLSMALSDVHDRRM